MEFTLPLKLEVEQQESGLAERVPITVQVFFRGGRWQAQCIDPPLCTELCESLEEAVVQSAKEAARALATA